MKRKSWQASFRTEVCKLPNMSDLPRCDRVLCVAQYPTYSWSLKFFFVELINKEKNNSISKAKEKVAKSNAPQKRLFKVILKLGLYWTIACIRNVYELQSSINCHPRLTTGDNKNQNVLVPWKFPLSLLPTTAPTRATQAVLAPLSLHINKIRQCKLFCIWLLLHQHCVFEMPTHCCM